jgi:hypothetical protein
MADLGSKAALTSANDTRINDNTSQDISPADVRDSFTDTVDTIYAQAARDRHPVITFSTNTTTNADPGQATIRFNNGTIASVTEIALSDADSESIDKGDLNSRCAGILQLRTVASAATIEFLITAIVHTSWTRYTVTYLKGSLPTNGTAMTYKFLPSNAATPAVTTALAGKADAYKDATLCNYQRTITGLADSNGRLIVNLTTLTPAFSAAHFQSAGGDGTGGTQISGRAIDETLATFTVQFWDIEAAQSASENTSVLFTVIGTKA